MNTSINTSISTSDRVVLCARQAIYLVCFLFLFNHTAYAGTLSIGPFGQGAYSGTEPFNTSGKCHEPGDDCNNRDARVRTGDLIQFAWSIAANDFKPGEADFSAVVLEQTIIAEPGAIVRFDRIPTVCLSHPAGPGGDNPVSSLVVNADGSQTLLCNLGDLGAGEQKSFSIPVRPSANSLDSSTFRSTQFVYALDEAGRKIVANQEFIDNTVYQVSAAPAFDLMADRIDMVQGARVDVDLGNGAGTEPGYMVHLQAQIAADAVRKGKGVEALDDAVSFNAVIQATKKDGVTPVSVPYKMMTCQPNSTPWPEAVYGNEQLASQEPLSRKVVNSGSCTFVGDDQLGHQFTLRGIDSQGARYPTETATGQSLNTGPFFVAAYQIGFFIPFSAIEAADGDDSGNGGAINLSTCLTEFDPNSNTGVSNYASGYEPGYNGEAMPDGSGSNNCTGPLTLQLSSSGGFNHRLVATVTDAGGYTIAPLIDVAHSGATAVESTTRYAHMETFSNTGSSALDNFQACFRFDNTVSKLVEASLIGGAVGKYAFLADDTSADFDRSLWRVLYGQADFGDDSPLDKDADGHRDFNAHTGRYEGRWEGMRTSECDDNIAPRWVSDPSELGVDNINVVRFAKRGDVATILAGQSIKAFLPLEMREYFVGGMHDGQAIPVGTVAAAVSSFRTDQFYPRWRPVQYTPSPESSQGDGDRVTYTKIAVNAVISTQLPLAPAGETRSVLAGNDVVWKINAAVKSKLPDGGVAQALRIVSELPVGSSYSARCTRALSGGSTPSFIEYNVPTAGQQTLTWDIGDVHTRDSVQPVLFCAATDPFAEEGTVSLTKAFAQASNATASVPTEQAVALGQSGEIRTAASVDVERDAINDTQVHTLKWINFSETTAIDNPIVINVLPFVGDEQSVSHRHPASRFDGSLRLLTEPAVSFADGSLPAHTELPLGVLQYTADSASTVSDNPDLNESHWCIYNANQFQPVGKSTNDCPKTFGEVSAIKFISNHALASTGNPRSGQQLRYTLSAVDNRSGNVYTNIFGLTSNDLPLGQVIRSRSSTVTINSHSIGDLIFVDVNSDGKYTKQVDVLAPDGIKVELHRASDDALLATTKTSRGTFLFDLLGDGQYYVLIPAEEFAANTPLRDWTVAPNGKASNADANHDEDHSGFVTDRAKLSGIRTDVINLTAKPAENASYAQSGQEPIGDNTFGLTDIYTNDDFSNLTIDIGLTSGDADQDGVLDIFEYGSNRLSGFVDSDGDGVPNYLDVDSDNDGIEDGIEAALSVSTLGFLPRPVDHENYTPTSTGIAVTAGTGSIPQNGSTPNHGTALESRIADVFQWGMLDSDGDGTPNYQDQDSDNDGIPDALERISRTQPSGSNQSSGVNDLLDADGDGVANYIDLDSDNDGVSDTFEAGLMSTDLSDSDGDGINDTFDVSNTGGQDNNADGVDDHIKLIDRDADGRPDYSDVDADGDGLPDLVEFGNEDINTDGLIDNFIDTNGDGAHDGLDLNSIDIGDTDADGIPDTHDVDSDGDGVPDVVEIYYQSDIDIDADGLAAQHDLDSDNDGVADGIEFGITGIDNDGDGIDKLFDASSVDSDLNADGIADRWLQVGLFDADDDGLSDANDTDSDNDGLSDAFENRTGDDDNNGQLDTYTDANNDGLDDKLYGRNFPDKRVVLLPDSDADGQIDALDLDSDNDGIPDALESQFIDFDADGIPDFRDVDSDNDGLHDRFEARSLVMDADRDGISNVFDVDVTNGSDLNADGIDDRLDYTSLLDSDSDGFPDHLDLDSDGDTLSDLVEAGGIDNNNDGTVDGYLDYDNNGGHDGLGQLGLLQTDTDNDGDFDGADTDADNDGVPDYIEQRLTGAASTDSDGDGLPDYRDTDADNDGISDGIEAGLVIGTVNTMNQASVTDDDLLMQHSANAAVGFNYYRVLDSDGDGSHNLYDHDSDNDGISDAIERGADAVPNDSDADGVADYIDVDSDNDGIPDRLESLGDQDSDGVPDRLDTDSDNDGLADAFESGLSLSDTDADGITDAFDVDHVDTKQLSEDNDNDGIDDAAASRGLTDSDNDNIPDFRDTDSDNDGIRDSIERGNTLLGVDSNNDSVPDYLSTDSDGDGVSDAVEFGATTESSLGRDTDGDGVADYQDLDSDNDGLSDRYEAGGLAGQLKDSDGDSIADMLDEDSDNDGILDSVEGLLDSDNDGVPNFIDGDSNNDGLPDSLQNNGDDNGDGIPDRLALLSDTNNRLVPGGLISGSDSDGDGIPDAIEIGPSNSAATQVGAQARSRDTDGDGVADMFDLDSDNDGIPDAVEAIGPHGRPANTDDDALPDYRDLDSDNDGVSDAIELTVDFDHDTIADYRDVDSDNDGVPDSLEQQIDSDGDGMVNRHDLDSDGDGVPDEWESATSLASASNTEPVYAMDTDQDGLPNFIDTDSDNDGLSDTREATDRLSTEFERPATSRPKDSDGDGIPDFLDLDSDNDNLSDASERDTDHDGDGLPNYLDRDGNGNGIDDLLEQSQDTDSDGVPDLLDADNDNDGLPDGFDGYVDTDGDGLLNYIDLDSDGDGISDATEAGETPTIRKDTDRDGIEDRFDLDSDNDGVSDELEGSVDTDLDGVPDHIDADSDNDGVSDVVEAGFTDSDGDGKIDRFVDDNQDGLSDQILITHARESDSDGDGIADRLEPGISASTQSSLGVPSALLDTDGDGISDELEGEGDFDGDGLLNKQDLDSDNDALLDEQEFGFTLFTGKDSDADGHPDFLDNDSDNDGLSDVAEILGRNSDQNVDGFIDGFIDENENGVDDSIDLLSVIPDDTDNDGLPDYLDLDSDGDGRFDIVEAGGQDNDGDGLVDGMRDSDADMIPDSIDVDYTRGEDADGDGIDDIGDADFFERAIDQDNDGIIDSYDIDWNENGFANAGVADGAPQANWPDIDLNGVPDVKQSEGSSPLNDEGVIRAGIDGDGGSCSVGIVNSDRFDPLLFLLSIIASVLLYRRRVKK